jgi:phosphatidylinositol glycan class C protein
MMTNEHTSNKTHHGPQPQQRCLWKEAEEDDKSESISDSSMNSVESREELLQRFSSKPRPKSFLSICQSTFVVGQEFVLVAYFLARQQRLGDKKNYDTGAVNEDDDDDMNQVVSHVFVLLALLLVLVFNNLDNDKINLRHKHHDVLTVQQQQNQQHHPRRIKIKQRSIDAILLALLLRLLAAVLRTLTESYSSDTVHALANTGLALHLLTCNYAYANGKVEQENVASASSTTGALTLQKRPAFLGGTVSLNAAFFSTILLASRLSSNSRVYVFVSLSVVMFAFYPAARHGVSQHAHAAIGK